jgi:hypothetical protein
MCPIPGLHCSARERSLFASPAHHNHDQEKSTEVPEGTGFVEQSLGAPEHPLLQVHELIAITRRCGELEVEINAREERTSYRQSKKKLSDAERLPAIAIGSGICIKKYEDTDGE